MRPEVPERHQRESLVSHPAAGHRMDIPRLKTYTLEIQPASENRHILDVLRDCLENGAPGSWERFVTLAKPVIASGLSNAIRRWNGDRSLTDDLVQDVFTRLCAADFRVLHNFRGREPAALYAYLRVIAASVAADRFRAEPARAFSLDDPQTALFVPDDRSVREIERDLLLDRIEKCLAAHDRRSRWIFWLYHRQGMTPKAISALPSMDLGRSGVETLLYRLTKAVADCVRRGFPPAAEGTLG
jgi:RNA polymerase sigma-70 factor, ECF subfamily